MKGTVILRFVGNRQEPEQKPVEEFVWPGSSNFSKEIDEWYEFVKKLVASSFDIQKKESLV